MANRYNARTTIMELPKHTDRRTVLKTVGAGVAGGIAVAGNAAASPRNNFGYVESDSELEDKTVTISGPPRREKVFCDAGGSDSESRIKTQVWSTDYNSEELYLIPSGYDDGDTVTVAAVFTSCTRNKEIKGEVTITKK